MEPLLGSIQMFAGSFAPVGWAICDGQLLQNRENQGLFTILGNQYGGDGKVTFVLPKLVPASAAAEHVRYIIALQGAFPRRS